MVRVPRRDLDWCYAIGVDPTQPGVDPLQVLSDQYDALMRQWARDQVARVKAAAMAALQEMWAQESDRRVAEALADGRQPCPVEVAGGLVGCMDAEVCEFLHLCTSVVTR